MDRVVKGSRAEAARPPSLTRSVAVVRQLEAAQGNDAARPEMAQSQQDPVMTAG